MARRTPDILDFFSGDPRPAQVVGLREVQSRWDSADVFVIPAETGSGKGKISECIIKWAASKRVGHVQSAVYGVPNNVLLNQAEDEFTGFDFIRRRDLYDCVNFSDLTCAARHEAAGAHCRSDRGPYARDACPYLAALRRLRSGEKLACTFHSILGHDIHRDLMVLDEAHLVRPMLQEQAGVRLWRRDWGWPRKFRNLEDVVNWLVHDLPSDMHSEQTDRLWSCLTSATPTHIIDLSPQEFRGRMQECVGLLPLDVRGATGFLSRSRKLVLMSATIGRLDVRALGLDRRRVAYIDLPPTIPPDHRPIVYHPVADMRFTNRSESIETMARWIVEEYLPAWPRERGLIHATYAVAEEIRRLAGDEPRLMFHTSTNKSDVLRDFLQMRGPDDNRVLVGSGMTEGLDLRGDLARHQLITSVPRGNVGDPATGWLARNKPEEYEWDTIRQLVQAAGRVCRGAEDFGETCIADSSFGEMELHSEQLPRSFRDALVIVE